MKVCRECNIEKSFSEFYKHAAMSDGHLNKCIPCVKSRVSKHRAINLEAIRSYDNKRSKEPHRVQARNVYMQTEAGKLAKKRATEAYHKRYPMAYAAHVMARNAIRDGRLATESCCSVCGSTKKIEGHHDDYTKPFDLRWLCEQCHKTWHKNNKPIYS
jgi:hypothetical protein